VPRKVYQAASPGVSFKNQTNKVSDYRLVFSPNRVLSGILPSKTLSWINILILEQHYCLKTLSLPLNLTLAEPIPKISEKWRGK